MAVGLGKRLGSSENFVLVFAQLFDRTNLFKYQVFYFAHSCSAEVYIA